MRLHEIRTEIDNIERRISSIKKSQNFAKEQLQKLESRLHFLYSYENQYEEYYAGIN